jgi:hypothetical protein
MNIEGWRGRSRPKKSWFDCVIEDTRVVEVSDEMTTDIEEWKETTCCAELE